MTDLSKPTPANVEKKRFAEELPFALGIFISACVWTFAVVVTILCYTGFALKEFSIGLLATFAASAVGGTVGFLFGVPKGPSDSDGQSRSGYYYRPNTNLEQVSDWLTKIIVGIGLIQFRQIGNIISDLGQAVGAAVGDIEDVPGSGKVFAIALMSATAAVTFLLAYMWTTTTLYEVYSDTHRPSRVPAPSFRPRRPTRR
jgi:hypothetical protein